LAAEQAFSSHCDPNLARHLSRCRAFFSRPALNLLVEEIHEVSEILPTLPFLQQRYC
jgi:hypothetical protein